MMYTIQVKTIVLVISLVSLILGTTPVSATIQRVEKRLDEDQVISRYKNECAGRDISTETCKSLRRDLEEVYFMVFQRMTASRKKGAVDRKYILLAARAREFMTLREIGLWTLAHEGDLTDDEKKLFAAELNSPYPALRKIAWNTLLKPEVSGRRFKETSLGVDRRYRKIFGKVELGAPRGMFADRPPESEWMMLPPFPEGDILYYASGKGGAVFETGETASEVLAFYKKKGYETIGYIEMLKQASVIQNAKAEEMMAKMISGGDPATLAAEMEELEKSMQNFLPKWIPNVGLAKDLTLVGEPIKIAGETSIKPHAAVWTNPALKKVGIAIPYDPDTWKSD